MNESINETNDLRIYFDITQIDTYEFILILSESLNISEKSGHKLFTLFTTKPIGDIILSKN